MSKNLLVSCTVENICLYSFQIQSKKDKVELHYLLPLYSGFCSENFPVFSKRQGWCSNKIKFKLFVLSQSCNLKFSVHSSWLKKVVLTDTVIGLYFLCFFSGNCCYVVWLWANLSSNSMQWKWPMPHLDIILW